MYDWTIVDRIFDVYRGNGVRPYVQIGFMPQSLSVKPEPYRHQFPKAQYHEWFTGWAYPPKDFAKWEELVYQWAKHCVERYGEQEVLNWYWQTWNEPTPVKVLSLCSFRVYAKIPARWSQEDRSLYEQERQGCCLANDSRRLLKPVRSA